MVDGFVSQWSRVGVWNDDGYFEYVWYEATSWDVP